MSVGTLTNGGCSALGTKTDAGDVIIGRNLDLTVSQYPCYITRMNYGKYETLNFTYDELGLSPKYLNRCDLVWAHSDCNFEDLQKGMIRYYTESGIFDKLNRYYSGDEQPLRDDSNIWTTALSLSVNCTQKRLTVKFWEKPNTVMHFQW